MAYTKNVSKRLAIIESVFLMGYSPKSFRDVK